MAFEILRLKLMKKFIIKTVFFLSITLLFFISCTKPVSAVDQNLEEVKADLSDTKAILEQANFDSINDFNKFKLSMKLKIGENQKVLNNLKLDIDSKDKVFRRLENSEINKLEKRNAMLKYKIENYEQSSIQKFEFFKDDVKNQLDDLRISISSMAEYDK